MRSPRIIVTVALASLMAFVISACQKNSQTDMSAATDTTQVSQSGTMPPDQTQPGAQGATLPDNSKSTTTKSTKTTHTTHTTTRGSSGSSSQGSQGTYA